MKKDKIDGNVARMVKVRNSYSILVGVSHGKRPREVPRHTWEDNIRMDVMK
jgi:hypothetical protein